MRLPLWGFQQGCNRVSALPAGSLQCEKRIFRITKNFRGRKHIHSHISFLVAAEGRAKLSVFYNGKL